jgi:membrane peptidoglycan carboxypeptidase
MSHLGVMAAVAAVLGVVVAGLAIPFAGLLGVSAKNMADTMDQLPAELKTEALAQRTKIVDDQGDTIATLYDENRVNVPLSQISRTMVKAIVAIEDYRFYEHGALDLKGTLRALITNQANEGVVQGGSSITQQMVKLTLLSQATTKAEKKAATDDTYARKLRELRYAIAVEQRYSKDWILERYLNIAYFGDGAFGVQAAARHYFNVNARDLNLAQSSMLAGLVKNPTGYDPTNAPDRALERRNVVLDRMAELNVISRDKAAKIKEQKLRLHVRATKNGCVNSQAPFFCDYVINMLMKDDQLGSTPEERKKLLYSGGLTIKTTVNLTDQAAADSSVSAHVFAKDEAIGALAMIEPGTGDVKALAQSRPMGRDKKAGQTFLNYTVPKAYGDANGFQAGSTFKAFVLAAALSEGVPLSQTFDAQPTMTFDAASFANCPGANPFGGPFTVSNSTSSGVMDVYRGTRESVNTFYVQLERLVGVCKPYQLAKKMGIRLTNPEGDAQGNGAERVPIFTLGVADVSPLEMAEAYATFGARGLHCSARPVTAILDANDNTLKTYPSKCEQVMTEEQADAENDVLRGVQEPGGFGYDLGNTGLSVPSAGKTGTTQDGKSVWFMGYTPQIATAAMIAGANSFGTPIPLPGHYIGGNYIYSVTGSGFAGPMWADAMHVVDDNLDYEDFVPPNPDLVNGVLTALPSVAGLSIDAATQTLTAAGFKVYYGGIRDSANPVGTVAYTLPAGSAPSGSLVTIYGSSGHAPPPPPKHNGGGGGGGDQGGGGTTGPGNSGGHGHGH